MTGAPETRPPRPGEELPLDKLAPYLRAHVGPADAEVTVAQFPGGHSNLTYLVTIAGRELVLRRPPFGSKVKSAHDMHREYHVLSHLAPVYPRAPRPVHECTDEEVIGAPFYLMERLRGVILRRQLPPGLTIDPPLARRLGEALIDGLIELHALDYRAVGLEGFGKPDGYVERQVAGWAKRYRDAETDAVPEMDTLGEWLVAHQPVSPPATIIHNDFKYDNVVLDANDLAKIVGFLDWEMATVGDPLMDLGTTLCYWVQPDDPPEMLALAFGPTLLPGSMKRAEVAQRYAERTGRDLAHLDFYYKFGLWKTAVVLQQIHYRWKKGLTKDERFATLNQAVAAFAHQAMRSTGV